MNKKKLFAIVINLILVIAAALPGTLAVSTDRALSDGTVAVSTETAMTEADTAIQKETENQDETKKRGAFAHIDSCSDDCAETHCKCACHLFNKIMACTTLDEIWTAFDNASDETIDALTDKQNAKIDAKIKALEPAPVPAVAVEEGNEKTVQSDVVYRTVNYTFVAPFGDPVTGGQR